MDETCLKLGVEMQTRLALRLLEREVNPAIIRVNGKSCFVKEESGDSCTWLFCLLFAWPYAIKKWTESFERNCVVIKHDETCDFGSPWPDSISLRQA